MNWKFPLSPSQVTGRDTLTGAKPVTRIHAAVGELQDKVVTDVVLDIDGLQVTHAYVRQNTLVIRGGISSGGNENAEDAEDSGSQENTLNSRVAALEAALSGMTLANNLRIANGGLTLDSTLTLGDGTTINAQTQTVETTTCAAYTPT